MGAENAVQSGVGKVILDVRRGLGPAAAFHYTIPVLATSDQAIARDPDLIASGMRAVMAAQRALKADPGLAAQIGAKLFPKAEAALIGNVVARDLPFYAPDITDAAVAGLVRFTRAVGMLKGSPTRADMVAEAFSPLWSAPIP
jgi:ABC-type nitrate/sulfonate/bicarbonate transport system substrate-binding protein